MAGKPRSVATRTAEGDADPPARGQPCLIRVFICDRPMAPGVRYPLGAVSEVTIGRGADAVEHAGAGHSRRLELRLDDSWMSRSHATLTRALRRWRLEDAGSKNGTLLNGAPVQRATLADGDVLEVGQTLFVYRDAVADLEDGPDERARPRSPTFDDVEDAGLAIAAALTRLGAAKARFLPAAARLLVEAWPVELDRCLRPALAAAAGAAIGPRHLPSPVPRRAAETAPRFVAEGELVAIHFGDATARLKDGDGLRYLAHLVERPGVEVHVLDLVGAARGGRAADEAGGLGDAGPLLDAGAKAAYKQRLLDLRAIADQAESFGDHARATRAREELDLLAAELSRAVGLGGRDRKAASATERARVNVTQRIRAAMKRIAEACPPLGQHLEAAIRTGTFCSYRLTSAAPPP